MTPGRLITLEGIDGAGKSTNIPYICDLLKQRDIEVFTTREPGGTALGESIRSTLLEYREDVSISGDAELLLVFAARAQHLEEKIKPALMAGKWVVCDRFTDATYAYQGGGRGIDEQRIGLMETWVQASVRPDLTLLFDLPVTVGLQRAGKRSPTDRFEREANQFLEFVRANYLARKIREPDRIKKIDAAVDQKDVRSQISQILDTFLKRT